METIMASLITGFVAIVVCVINNHYQMKKVKAEQDAQMQRLKAEQKETTEKELESLKLGVQALLRNALLEQYDKWGEIGYCPYDKKQSVDNMHTQYANLGVNGVMDEAHREFMRLPLQQN